MVSHLYIVRHGIAVPHGTPGVTESQRPLTPKGESRVHDIARALERLDLELQRIVTSPLPRAYRTAEILAERLTPETPLQVDDALSAGAPPRALRDWLATRREDRLMIVGHNPDFTELVALLTHMDPPPFDLKKGGVAALEAEPGGGYALEWLATPGLIRKLAGE
ncbi:MAG: phosphoglycerate mutase family protein [Isosphaeraceae bacterium]